MDDTKALTPKKKAQDLRAYLETNKGRLAEAIPETMRRVLTPERVMRIVGAAISRTPDLANCTPQSVALAVMGAVQLGLEPGGPLGHAYLVPFRNRKTGTTECQLITGYRGLLALARRTGEIKSIDARVVRAADRFTYSYGLDATLEHVPHWDGTSAEGGQVVAAYAIIRLADGGMQVEVMTRGEIDAIRTRSRAGDSGPWATDYAEMARKTVLRRALKYAPQSVELASALEADDDDAPPTASDAGYFAAVPEAPETAPSATAGLRERLRADAAAAPVATPAPRVTTVRRQQDGSETPVEPRRDGGQTSFLPPPAQVDDGGWEPGADG